MGLIDRFKWMYGSDFASPARVMAELGASGEDVDLWLDVELFLDVRLESGEWCEAETIEVNGRWIRVQFFARQDLEPIWLNVDTASHRLAELHTKSNHHALIQQADQHEAMGAAAAAASHQQNGIHTNQAVVINEEEAGYAIEMYQEVLTRNSAEFASMIQQDGDQWLLKQGQKRLRTNEDREMPNRLSMPPKSKSCFVSSSFSYAAAAAASSSSLAADDDILMRDSNDGSDGLFKVSAISIKFPLFDSHTHNRLVVPVRSPNCVHPEAFDLWTHIQHRLEVTSTQPVWQCPICKKEAWSAELLIDPIIFHTLRLIEDGRLAQHAQSSSTSTASLNGASVPTSFTFTPNSPLMSMSSFSTSLASMDQLKSSPPKFGQPASNQFEERRLTLNLTDRDLRLSISTGANDANQREAKRHGQRRARTMPTLSQPSASPEAMEIDVKDGDPSSLSGGSPWKKLKSNVSDQNQSFSGMDPPTSAAAAAASSSMTAAAASSSNKSSSNDIPWPCWTDADGCIWIDVRDGPADIEGPDRWGNIRVKIETAHAQYEAIQQQRHEELNRPPPSTIQLPQPMVPPNLQFLISNAQFSIPSSDVIVPPAVMANFHVTPEKLRAPLMAIPPSSQRPPFMGDRPASQSKSGLSSASSATNSHPSMPHLPPGYSRAATLPAPSSSSSSHLTEVPQPKKKKRTKKPERAATEMSPTKATSANIATAPTVATSSTVSTSTSGTPAAAAAAAIPLIPLNTCSVYDLMSIDGVGPKMAHKIIEQRMKEWLMEKVNFNDTIQERQAANEATANQSSSSNSHSMCDCATPNECHHVRAFSSWKSLREIEGIGAKMLTKLQQHLTL